MGPHCIQLRSSCCVHWLSWEVILATGTRAKELQSNSWLSDPDGTRFCLNSLGKNPFNPESPIVKSAMSYRENAKAMYASIILKSMRLIQKQMEAS